MVFVKVLTVVERSVVGKAALMVAEKVDSVVELSVDMSAGELVGLRVY